MRTKNLFPFFFAASLLGACAEATDDSTTWPDAEFGIEADGKDDSFAIRPGSKEAEAVLSYVNQPLASDAAGAQFYDAINARLDRRAAVGIRDHRSGADGRFGTADDQRFADLNELDSVRWVGRTALMRLFELADEAGLFNRASVECSEFIQPSSVTSRGHIYRFHTLASLLEVENSKCEIIRGTVEIRLQSTDLLPPSRRHLKNFEFIKVIEGDLVVDATTNMEGADFDRLESVSGRLILRDGERRDSHIFRFPSLTKADVIDIQRVGPTEFGSLEESQSIVTQTPFVNGFTALKSADGLRVHGIAHKPNSVEFPALERVERLTITRLNQYENSWTQVYEGGFPKLASAGELNIEHGVFGGLTFPVLKEIDTDFTLSFTQEALKGFGALEIVGGSYVVGSSQLGTGVHEGLSTLKRVEGTLRITENKGVHGYDALEYLGGSVIINVNSNELVGFGKVEQLLGNTQITAASLNAFGNVVDSMDIYLNLRNAASNPVVFAKLKEIDGGLQIVGARQALPVFDSLEAISGELNIDSYAGTDASFPELVLIQGSLTIQTGADVAGFAKLRNIESNLSVLGSIRAVSGMANLRGVGADIYVTRQLPVAERDSLLDQLEEFSGGIFLR